jgi:chemotaxis protein methyltransferase CheR
MQNNTFSTLSGAPSIFASPRDMAPAPAHLTDKLVQLISQRTMMQFGVERNNHFLGTLADRTKATNSESIANYVLKVMSPLGASELQILIDALTINETTFFRNLPQINLCSQVIIPEIIARKRTTGVKRLDIWSAACSTGQEVYTLAISAYEALKFVPAWAVKVWGTDISPTVLDTARRGVYPKARLDTMPPQILSRYFDATDNEIKVKDVLKQMTSFREHNLRDPFPPLTYDIIFCRNVMIYFSRADQEDLARRFRERLTPGGFLFIGHSESLQGLNVDFKVRLEKGGVVYQRPLEG